MDRSHRWISLSIRIGIVTAALAIGAFFVKGMLPANPEAEAAQAGLWSGRHLPATNIPWNDHHRTLILAIRRGCHFCEQSMPFYRKLAHMEADRQFAVHIIAALPDDPASAKFFLKCQDLKVQAIPNTPLHSLFVTGTPTAILVNRHGTVLQAWDGELNARQQGSLIAALVHTGK